MRGAWPTSATEAAPRAISKCWTATRGCSRRRLESPRRNSASCCPSCRCTERSAAAGSREQAFFKRLSTPLLLDDELVLDAKRSRHGTRAHAGDRLVAHVVDHAEERDRAVLHDDVQGVVTDRLHAGKPAGAHRVKAGAEPMPVAPQ